jgi:Flp pilus assembly pilin Flp
MGTETTRCAATDRRCDRMHPVSVWRRSEGQTMSEYAVVLAVITPAIVAGFALLSDAVVERLEAIAGFFT